MVQSGSSARYKRMRRKFSVIAGCIWISEDNVLLTLATNRRNNSPVGASCEQKNLRRRDKYRRVKGIARVMLQSISSTRYKRARWWFDSTVECAGMHEEAVLSPTLVVNHRNNPALVT